MYEAVLFDLDGTIIDSSEGILNATKETLSKLGMDLPSDDEIRSCIGPPIGESLGKMQGFSELDRVSFNGMFRKMYKEKYLFQCSLYPGIVSLLEDIKRAECLIGISTNKRDDTTKLLIEHLGIIDLFDVVVAQDSERIRRKSDMISEALSSLGIDRDHAVMIGDTQSDLDAAKDAGVEFIGVSYGFGFKESAEEEIKLADSVGDLRELLLG